MSSTTADRISIPALAPSGAGSPPNALTRPTADSGWPKPGHWAVPAFLVVALMIGILWFYSSFFGSSTTPEQTPTLQPGFAFSTPAEAPVDPAFLEPVTRADCGVAPLSLVEIGAYQVNPGESVPRVYGPIAPVSDAEAVALYEASLTSMACEAFGNSEQKQAVLSPRHIYEGRHDSIARNSASVEEYIANNEALAAILLDPNRTNYTAVSSQEIPVGTQTTPVAIDSWFGYRLIPQDVVQFPDGRMGGPLTWVLPANYDEYRQDFYEETNQPTPAPYEFTVVEYAIFAEHDDQWLLDERFTLCAANCDQWRAQAESFYQQSQSLVLTPTPIVLPGTPATSSVASPGIGTPAGIDDALLDPGECTITPLTNEEISALQQDPSTYPARQNGPTSPVGNALASEIAEINREFTACANEGNWRSMASQRLIYEAQLTGNYAQTSFALAAQAQGMTAEEYIAWHRDLSTTLLPGDISDYVVLSDRDIATITGYVVQPHQVVQLADGRIGAPESLVLPPDNGVGRGIPLIMSFNIYIQDSASNNRWVLDESLLLCVGECDMFYEQMARDLSVLPASTPLPAASPVAQAATPASDDNAEWLVNPEENDCERNVNPLPDTFPALEGTIAIGDYIPFAEADPETQVTIARQFQLLAANCASGPDGNPMISEDMSAIPDPSEGPVTQEQLDLAIAVSGAFSTRDPLDFVLEAEPGLISPIGYEQVTASIGIMFPESVVQLPDGRYGAPLHIAIETIDPAGARGLIAEQGVLITPLYIFTTLENGSPQLDEVLWICLGDCDDYWASYEIINSPIATPAASPAATPVANPLATPADARTIRFR
jgi:hypothetical protein